MATARTPDQIAAELLGIANREMSDHVRARTGDTITLSSTWGRDETITQADYDARQVRAASIMYAESGGHPDARRDAADNPGGGNDRGLWQINDKAWPNVPDAVAYDPQQATAWAYQTSKGFTTWGPWRGSRGLDPNSAESRQVAKVAATGVKVLPETSSGPIGGPLDVILDKLPGGVTDLFAWPAQLARLLGNLLSSDWWRRVGVGALGLLLVLIAVAFTIAAA
jgi:hypothetical protein